MLGVTKNFPLFSEVPVMELQNGTTISYRIILFLKNVLFNFEGSNRMI